MGLKRSALIAALSSAIGCTGNGETFPVENTAFSELRIELEDEHEGTRRSPPSSPPDELMKVELVEAVIVLDAGDTPTFWSDTWTDRLPLELRLHPFGDLIHVELRNTGRDRVYWVGYPLSPNNIFIYSESAGSEPILQAPCYYTPEDKKYDVTYAVTTYSLAPGETLPLATVRLTRTIPDWVVAWKDDTAWCLVVPVGAELRAGLIATDPSLSTHPWFGFIPPAADGFPSRTDPFDIHRMEPPTKAQFERISKLADRRSNALILHPAEKPFEGPALRRTKPRGAPRPAPADPMRWRPYYPAAPSASVSP
jgi:hypothetical protein